MCSLLQSVTTFFSEAVSVTKEKLNMGGFPTGQGRSWSSGLLLWATVPLLCSGQQTPCVTSSQGPQEAEEVLEQGRAKSIKTEPRSQQPLAVSLPPLAPGSELAGGGQGVQPLSGSRGAEHCPLGSGADKCKGLKSTAALGAGAAYP